LFACFHIVLCKRGLRKINLKKIKKKKKKIKKKKTQEEEEEKEEEDLTSIM
jgi:hypothetical protein